MQSRIETNGVKQALTYLRVSTSAQADTDYDSEGYSIPAQREACIRKAESLNATVVDEYIDRGESAKTADRPALKAMLERLKLRADVDYVIVHKVDRLARSRTDDVLINLALKKAGAVLVSCSENIDETPSGLLLHAIMSGVAEFYSRNLATEILKGTTQKARAGGTPTRAPIGYLNVREKVDGREIRTVALDPERAPLVKWAFEQYATGNYSLQQLHTAITDKGLRTLATRKFAERELYLSKVAHMLHNPYYMGIVTYRGQQYEGRHEPLVSPGLFARVQEVLEQHRLAGDRTQKHHHYLKGTIVCGSCGGRLIFSRAHGNGGLYDYFHCQSRQKNRNCKLPYLLVADVEKAIGDYYNVIAFASKTVEVIRREIFRFFDSEAARRKKDVTRLTSRLTTLKQESRKLIQLGLTDSIPEEIFREEQLRIRTEIKRAEAQLQVAQGKLEESKTTADQALALIESCADAYRKAPATVRRQWNQAFFVQLRVHADLTIVGELKPPFSHLVALDFQTRYRREKRPIAVLKKEYANNFWHNAGTPALVFSGRGSNYADLVELRGLEPLTPWLPAKCSTN